MLFFLQEIYETGMLKVVHATCLNLKPACKIQRYSPLSESTAMHRLVIPADILR